MVTRIKISDLRIVINLIFNHIEHDLKKENIFLEEDDYWDIIIHERYDFRKIPENFEHGQLSDDWHFLSSILNDKDQALDLMLMHVAPLLRYISDKVCLSSRKSNPA
jgi:hypothetical protein